MAITQESLRRTNENPGTRAHLNNLRTSAYKVREVLDIVRGKSVKEARDILKFTTRGSAEPVLKLLNSAVANAEHNDGLSADELFITACYADEGTTMKRFRPRAKGRASRIRKRGSHVTIIVARMDEEKLARLQVVEAQQSGSRAGRVAGSRAGRVAASKNAAPVEETDTSKGEVVEAEAEAAEAIADAAPAESNTTPANEESATVADTVDEAAADEKEDK